MGMYDNIRCKFPLPDAEAQGLGFQTKDLNCMLDCYTITEDGRLILHYRELEEVPEAERPYYGKPEWDTSSLARIVGSMRTKAGSERDVDTNYHGYLNFYGSIHTGELQRINLQTGVDELHPGPEPEWYEYLAKFTDGRIVEIKRLRDDEEVSAR